MTVVADGAWGTRICVSYATPICVRTVIETIISSVAIVTVGSGKGEMMTTEPVDHSRWVYLHRRHCSIGLSECHVCQLIAEIDRLRALVRHTLDGEPIVNGMTVWQPRNPPFRQRPCPARVRMSIGATDSPFIVTGEPDPDIDPEQCYSTCEAAEAAKEK